MHPGCDAALVVSRWGDRQEREGEREESGKEGKDSGVAVRVLRWGLVPPRAGHKSAPAAASPSNSPTAKLSAVSADKSQRENHWKMFNARSETVDSLGVFKRLLRHGRCVLPINGFYEWTKDEFQAQVKSPHDLYPFHA
eukprot:scaffold89757_cov31-Tisochrysis_lutea.AAC.2